MPDKKKTPKQVKDPKAPAPKPLGKPSNPFLVRHPPPKHHR